MKTIVSVLGTRPEIVKFSPLLPRLDRAFRHILVHTGQHYDENMDRVFFRELRLKQPRFQLAVGSAGQGEQTGRMLERLEPILMKTRPDLVLVLGDTNSTLAGGIVAAKLNIPIGHIEAGCRSFNRRMPEEKNRVLVDHISTILFAPDRPALANLRREGIRGAGVHLVGNTGLDAVRRTMELAEIGRLKKFGVKPDGYALATLHRAENTDDMARFAGLIQALNEIGRRCPVLFPVHPRTLAVMKSHKIQLEAGVRPLPPLGNVDFIALLKNGLFVLSDSGGIQEEAAVVNRPCLILREDTEWTRLVKAGKNFLVGIRVGEIVKVARRLIESEEFRRTVARRKAPLQFGASRRILRILSK
jgi:UDP-N-acetylglucosamine 2-epimerase (non-hydrolysing)